MYKDFISCLNPRKVFNPQSKQWLSVGCGCCKACLQRLSRRASYQCSLQEQDYKFCMFVTLTYNNESIPLARVELCDENSEYNQYSLYDVTERFSKARCRFGDFLGYAFCSPSYLKLIRSKFCYFGPDVPYLSKYDAQCFLKRFRKHLNKITNDKVSYYIVGEYGPVHFRPHFHVLFFFNSDVVLQNFGQVLHKAWTFGRIDFSQSRGKCSSYVAQYVNSRNSVPRLYTDRAFRPFCLHSQKFAQGFYQNQKKQIYEAENFRFTDIMRQVGSSVSATYAWRSLVSAFFPKCRGFNFLSIPELTYSYTLLLHARKFYGKDLSISQLVDCICQDIFEYSWKHETFVYSPKTATKSYFLYFIHRNITRCDDTFYISTFYGSKAWRYCDLSLDLWSSVKASISSLLYLSNHFISFVCDSDTSLIHSRIDSILRFYNNRDYDNLVSQYDLQSTLLSDCDSSSSESVLYYLYDNVFPKVDDAGVRYYVLSDYEVNIFRALSEIPLFEDFLSKVNIAYNNSVKHKELNDLNNIFC